MIIYFDWIFVTGKEEGEAEETHLLYKLVKYQNRNIQMQLFISY